MLHDAARVRVNRAVVEHDVTIIVGPVFPHEVVGFSGGNKYLFPGVSGGELIDLSHWLGALITSATIIGTRGYHSGPCPHRRGRVDGPWRTARILHGDEIRHARPACPDLRRAVSSLGGSGGCVCRNTHPLPRRPGAPGAVADPGKYDDMWTGAKGFYKVEPIVADGGQVVLYAPHIREIATTHPAIAQIGYHCRDYFVKQWDRFKDQRWGDLAHSTHLRGAGTYDEANGERDRVTVTLATGIPEDVTRAINLDYLDPAEVDPAAWAAEPDTLVVPDAGEDLYRLR